ncbi:hypothetical protein NDU88_002199 [Pleurodeles waltl]|uniref:Uncharacterized protein n=1 Tax=Pleurodeles waltl TaxID=8319 RepID=A0AAV7W1S2_PLEWA|nr:hypothetical protein NDU88_002199 [Pleurodeles waltl]
MQILSVHQLIIERLKYVMLQENDESHNDYFPQETNCSEYAENNASTIGEKKANWLNDFNGTPGDSNPVRCSVSTAIRVKTYKSMASLDSPVVMDDLQAKTASEQSYCGKSKAGPWEVDGRAEEASLRNGRRKLEFAKLECLLVSRRFVKQEVPKNDLQFYLEYLRGWLSFEEYTNGIRHDVDVSCDAPPSDLCSPILTA